MRLTVGPLRLQVHRGTCWLACGRRSVFHFKDTKTAEHVLFADRNAAYHVGRYRIQMFGFPRFPPRKIML